MIRVGGELKKAGTVARLKKAFDYGTIEGTATLCELIVSQATALCPVKTGILRGSIGYAVKDGPSAGNIEPKGLSQGEALVGSILEYAPYVEFGTRKQAPQPFLRPSIAIIRDGKKAKNILKKILEEQANGVLKEGQNVSIFSSKVFTTLYSDLTLRTLVDSFNTTDYAMFHDMVVPEGFTGAKTLLVYSYGDFSPNVEYGNERIAINCRGLSIGDAEAIKDRAVSVLNRHALSSNDFFGTVTVLPPVRPQDETDSYNYPIEVLVKSRI
jgi:HK97 gp10 family phage protein